MKITQAHFTQTVEANFTDPTDSTKEKPPHTSGQGTQNDEEDRPDEKKDFV